MDALSELLRVVRLDSAIFFNAELSEPWCLASPESCTLAHVLTTNAGAAHVIIYHFLAEGHAYVELPSGERIALEAGELVTFPHGHAHLLGGGTRAQPVDVGRALPTILSKGLEPFAHGGGGPQSHFICGFLACDPQLSQGFLAGLPNVLRVNIRDDASGAWLENSLRYSVSQAASRDAGARAMLTKVSEALFAETLRKYASNLSDNDTGWFAGARDPAVGKALTLLHQRPSFDWTLADLAKQVGVSRTVLAERFKHYLDEPPMSYLTRWRLRMGASALVGSQRSVAEIAEHAGYESEAAFNRAFKREYGLPPARYRKDKSRTPGLESDAPG